MTPGRADAIFTWNGSSKEIVIKPAAGLLASLGVALFSCVMLGACGKAKTVAPAAPVAAAPAVSEANPNAPAIGEVAPTDYSNPAAWLCHSDAADPCRGDASATSVAPDGRLTKEKFFPAKDAPVDCFYVYPTVSVDPTPNSDINPGEEEKRSALVQVARFGSVCRIYAPIYRQTTLTALRSLLKGEATATNREMAYADVRAAFARYLANDNSGRGVILIGHDQGAGLLARLIASEIEGKPAQKLLVSAILLGSNIAIPDDALTGGSFKSVAPCLSLKDTGCFIGFVAFRADAPPPAQSLFGSVGQAGMHVACVNPAELDGSEGKLKAFLPSHPTSPFIASPEPWSAVGGNIETTFVTVPGLLTARCESKGGFSYLGVTTNGDAADPRTDAIVGDVRVEGVVQPAWGLHLIDMGLVQGNLIEVVKEQSKAWRAKQTAKPPSPPQ